MKTGFRGTFVISWSQTEVDGFEAAPVQSLEVGAAWSWRGDAVQVDGTAGVLRLDRADGSENLRKRAAKMVHRLVGAAMDPVQTGLHGADRPEASMSDSSFVVTDGGESVKVAFTGVLPDLFSENQGMVGTGSYVNGVFEATEILAKHDETYMPKEVVDALKEQGVYKEAGDS